MNIAFLGLILVVVGFATVAAVIRRYRRCPSDKILVVYGKTGGGSPKCIHGGGKFVCSSFRTYSLSCVFSHDTPIYRLAGSRGPCRWHRVWRSGWREPFPS